MTRFIIVEGAKKGLAVVVAAALILAAPGPGCYEAWAAAQKGTGGIPSLGGGLAAPVTPSQVPKAPSNTSFSGSIPALPESNISGAAAPVSAPAANALPHGDRDGALPRAAAASAPVQTRIAAPTANAAGRAPVANTATQLLRTSGQDAASPAGAAQAPDIDSIQSSAFRLFDNARGQTAGSAAPVFADKRGAAVQAAAGVGALSAATHSGRAIAAAILKAAASKVGLGAVAASAVQSALPWYSTLGNIAGNGLAFYFAVPQVYQTLKDGNAQSTPKGRAIALIVASLLLGGVNAVIAHSMFWGVQNLFGAISMASVFPLAKILRGRGVSPGKAKWLTVGIVAGLLGASVGLYFVASAFMPGLIAAALPATFAGTQALMQGLTAVGGGLAAAWLLKKAFALRDPRNLSPVRPKREVLGQAFLALLAAAIVAAGLLPALPAFLATLLFPMTAAQLTVAVQAVTSVLFLSLFAPDIVSIVKGKVPESFTTGFSMSFFLSSIGFIAWMKGELAQTPPHTSGWVRWEINLWVNVIYAIVSAISYWAARKEAKARANGRKPGDEDEPPTPPTPPILQLNLLPNQNPYSPAFPAPVLTPAAPSPMTPHTISDGRQDDGAVAPAKFFAVAPMSLEEAKARAQERVRKLSPGAQLTLASIDLTSSQGRWIFRFRGDGGRRLSIEIDAPPVVRSASFLGDERFPAAPGVVEALIRLKETEPEVRPARLELRPSGKEDPDAVFIDEAGREFKLPDPDQGSTSALMKVPTVAAAQPASPSPAQPPPEPPKAAPPGSPPADRAPPASTAGSDKESRPQIIEGGFVHSNSSVRRSFGRLLGFFGFRTVVGVRHDPELKTLPINATSSQIVDQISRQFNIPRRRVLEIARFRQEKGAGFDENSPAEEWYAVYRRLQKLNAEQFKRLDHEKYEGFRNLSNRTYAPDWKGTLARAAEVHKHYVGAFVRFSYHLFDMFVLGYFRQSLSFEFSHKTEDFLGANAEKWLEVAFKEQAPNGLTPWEKAMASPWGQLAEPILNVTVIPLATFLKRRVMMALASAVVMGLLGAAAPGLAVMSVSLTAVPLLGPALMVLAHGLPIAVAQVPLVGGLLAPVVGAATTALLKDMVIGPLLNTLALSTLLTVPGAVRMERMRLQDADPRKPVSWGRAIASLATSPKALLRTSWQVAKTFGGMVTVGAEIAGILSYAGQADTLLGNGYHAVTGHDTLAGHHITPFRSAASAVESQKGDSVIPFGGAITWGNTLLYQAQNWLGFNISDHVMWLANPDLQHAHANQVYQAAAHRQPRDKSGLKLKEDPDYKFDADLGKKSAKEIEDRIKYLADNAGDIGKELQGAREQQAALEKNLSAAADRIAQDKARLDPPEKRAADEARLKELKERLGKLRDESYGRSKLAEVHDLKNPQKDSDRRKELTDLLDQYGKVLPDASDHRAGFTDSLAVRQAALENLYAALGGGSGGGDAKHAGGAAVVSADTANKFRDIQAKLDEIDALRAQAQGEMAARDASGELLAVVNRARNAALNDRHSGKEMLAIHQNMSKLATVMDMSLALNEINSAEKDIGQMQTVLSNKAQQINQSLQQNQQNDQQAQQNQQQIQNYQNQNQQQLKSDQTAQTALASNLTRVNTTLAAIQGYQPQTLALINQIIAQDGGPGKDPLQFYNSRLQLMQQWAASGGPPAAGGIPDAATIASLQSQVGSALQTAQQGLTKIQTGQIPNTYFGALLIAPGPYPGANATLPSNPTPPQAVQYLAQVKASWQPQLTQYQGYLNTVNNIINTKTVTNAFGDTISLAQAQQQEAQSQASTKQYIDQINQLAAKINAECPNCHANLPVLPDNNLKQLEVSDVFTNYANALQAIQAPNDNSAGSSQATADILAIAQALPYAGRNVIQWAYADGVATAFNQALTTTLPQAQQGLTGLVNMVSAILADNQQDVNFVNGGVYDVQTFTALETRKVNLLQSDIIPSLQGVQTLLAALSSYQAASNADYSPTGNGGYAQLYSSDIQLWNSLQSAYKQTIPWAVETFGGPSGDAAASHAAVASYRTQFNNYLNGYTDSSGNNFIGINNYITEVGERADPNFNGTEQSVPKTFQIAYLQDPNYPGGGPFSLPQKITLYQGEMAQRAQQINTEDAQIDQILDQIKTVSGGKYDLGSYKLPTNVGADQGSVQTITNLTNNTVQSLADQLKAIGNANNTNTTINLPGGGTMVPTGNQGQLTISQRQQIAILALNAAQRLVPTSIAQPAGAPATYAMARFLYSNGIIQGVQKELAPNGQLAQAKVFLPQAQSVLSQAVAATVQADAYIDSGGTSLTSQQIYQNQPQLFQSLSGMLQQAQSFFNVIIQSDNDATSTINQVGTYYNGLNTIYNGGVTVNQSELTEVTSMQKALQNELDTLRADKTKISSWLSQLNDPHDSALRRVSESFDALQDKTRAVLVQNIRWHDLEDQLKRSNDILGADLKQLEIKQEALKADIRGLTGEQRAALSSKDYDTLLKRIDSLHLDKGVWAIDGKGQAQALVVRKDRYAAFVDSILGVIAPQGSSQDLGLIRADLLKNPGNLAQLIPGARLMDFGNDADGFYMVYQSQFGVPGGLFTQSWVTMGNVAKIFGSNVSVTGYQFGSPPEDKAVDGASNAPWGDKGVEVQIETLKGKNWVNYLNIGLHRFALDIPSAPGLSSQIRESRVMLFDDFAMMAAGGKFYLGLTGFGDVAANQPGNSPYYYGGNLKTSIQLSPVMALTAQQEELFAKDPRSFLETVNLDFTGYDPSLNQPFAIAAAGDSKHYSRTQLGSSINVAQLLHSPDPFTLDLYYAKSGGTDDLTQSAAGVSVIKGFTLHDSQGRPLAVISNKTSLEKGQKYNAYADQLSVTLPKSGIVVTGQGQILGNAEAYYGQVAKKMNDYSNIALGYGKQYVGENSRLSVSINSNFTLSQLWKSVVNNAGGDLRGGDQLKTFNADMNLFFDRASDKGDEAQIKELRDIFVKDVARKLLSQDIGTLSRDIAELREAGAIMDNTRTRGTVGFVSRGVSTNQAAKAVGGSFAAGTQTQMTLSKTQKELIDSKAASYYEDGLKLQERLLDLTKQWQQAVADIAQARAEAGAAAAMEASAPSETVRLQAHVRMQEAKDRLDQAVLRYNALAGREPGSPTPFDSLSASAIPALFSEVGKIVSAPDRMDDLFKGLHDLDSDQMASALGDNPRNVVDMLRFVDKLSIGFGAQMQDLMANQIFGVGGSVRLPIYDPHSKEAERSYKLEKGATLERMMQMYADQRLRAELEAKRAQEWTRAAAELGPESEEARRELSVAVRSYRNGLSGADEMNRAYAAWRWYTENLIEASANAAVGRAQAALDGDFKKDAVHDADAPVTLGSFEQALDLVQQRSHSLSELGQRAEAAGDMMSADNHRIQKFWLDLDVGMNLTATGVGWLPKINYTGIPIMPVPGIEFKPAELKELQQKEDQQDQAYYKALQSKVKSDLAVELYESLASYQAEQRAVDRFDSSVLPGLEAGAGDLPSRQALDRARLERAGHGLARDQAKATINYLLGRSADAPLAVGLDADRALSSVKDVLRQNNPRDAERKVLEARVQAAQAHEQIVDKDLKVTQAAAEPVSLAGRTLGRLIKALSDEDAGDADQVAAARVRTLTEQRALESYEGETLAKANALRGRILAIDADLEKLKDISDPQGLARALALEGEERALKAGLLALGDVRDPGGALWNQKQPMPETFERLRDRLAQAEETATGRPPETAPQPTIPGIDTRQATLHLRGYYARQELDRTPIGKNFVEGWLELRLKSSRTPPEVLLALSQLETQKADRLYRADQAGAAAKAAVLAEDFRANVQALRWLEKEIRFPSGQAPQNLAPLDNELKNRLEADRVQIVSALGLDPSVASLERLMALVPDGAGGPQALSGLSDQFIKSLREAGLKAIRQTVLDQASQGASEDGLISQIKADNLAQRMSYKGFTPIAAFGLFRGQRIGAGFLEAPDPRQVERGLTNILDESLRKDLEASGRMQELTTRLQSLMVKVQDGSEELESRRKLVEAAERDYRAQVGRMQEGPMASGDIHEALAARERLASAWTAFAGQLVQTKSDFVTLVSDIEAIDPKLISQRRDVPPAAAEEGDFGSWASDRRQDLLDYWTDRMLDKGFAAKQDAAISELGSNVPQDLRQALDHDVEKFRIARRDADAVMARDFSPEQRLRLLSINDLEGKRERLRADLSRLQGILSVTDPNGYLMKDLDDQAAKARQDRKDYAQAANELRKAYWNAVPPSDFAVKGAFDTLEKLKDDMQAARQKLLKAYMAGNDEDHALNPSRFVLKDQDLDDYLKAEEAFDAELVKTLQDPKVNGHNQLMWNLDALYNVRSVIEREKDVAGAGRGMLALDALIMLEESRLAAARWNGRPPQEIDQIAQALESLNETRERWQKGETKLEPLYAATALKQNGERVWTVKDWYTQKDIEDGLVNKTIEKDGGRYYLKARTADGLRQELAAGIDAREAAQMKARGDYASNHEQMELNARFGAQDLIAQPVDKKAAASGRSLQNVFFKDDSLYRKGEVYFFEKNLAPGYAVHRALNPMQALQMSPDQYDMYAYLGDKQKDDKDTGRLDRSNYLTRESLEARDDAKDFARLTLTRQGAQALMAKAAADAQSQRAQGWIDVKLNSYGFATDENGGIAELYLTKEEFAAARAQFANAKQNYEQADRALKDATDAKDAAEKRYHDAQRASGGLNGAGGNGAYQAYRAKASDALTKAFTAVLNDDERVKIEVEKRLSGDKNFEQAYAKQIDSAAGDDDALKIVALDQDVADYQKAQKTAAPQARELTVAENNRKMAEAGLVKAESAQQDAAALLDRVKKGWSLYESDSLTLALDAKNKIVGVSAQPEIGPRALEDKKLPEGAAVKRIRGPLYAAEIDKNGNLVNYFDDEGELDRAWKSWSLKSVTMTGENGDAENITYKDNGKIDEVHANPTVRISHYEDQGVPVDLSRRYLVERSKDDSGKAKHDEHWGLLPWQWGDLAMEVPRGLIDTPFEIASGRDARQEHYLGRVYMYKTEGGWTEHKGLIRKAAGVFDILDFLPDHAERFGDLSQFPTSVRLNSAVKPGQDFADKRMRDGSRDVHFGATALRRMARYDLEDLTAAKARTLDHFNGGVEELWVDQVRGRAGYYQDSRRQTLPQDSTLVDPGQAVIDQALGDPLLAGANLFSDGRMTLSATPGNLAIRQVERQVDVRRGAKQFESQAGRLKGYLDNLGDPAAADQGLREQADAAQAALEKDLTERQKKSDETKSVFEDFHKLGWRLAEQKAIDDEIKALNDQAVQWNDELKTWKDYLDKLAKIPLPGAPTPPGKKPGRDYGNGGLLAAWALTAFGLASVLSAAYEWLRRRKRDVEPPAAP